MRRKYTLHVYVHNFYVPLFHYYYYYCYSHCYSSLIQRWSSNTKEIGAEPVISSVLGSKSSRVMLRRPRPAVQEAAVTLQQTHITANVPFSHDPPLNYPQTIIFFINDKVYHSTRSVYATTAGQILTFRLFLLIFGPHTCTTIRLRPQVSGQVLPGLTYKPTHRVRDYFSPPSGAQYSLWDYRTFLPDLPAPPSLPQAATGTVCSHAFHSLTDNWTMFIWNIT